MELRWKEILLHTVFWLITIWLIASGFSIQSQEIEHVDGVKTVKIIRDHSLVLGLFACIGISLLMFYLNLWNLGRLKSSSLKAKVLWSSVIILLSALILSHLVDRFPIDGSPLQLPPSLSIGIVIFYFTISTAYGIAKIWVLAERRHQQLVIAKKQAELDLLRNQLHPHFLFNALNNLLSMVDQDESPQLATAFEKLSQLLRHVIDGSKSQKVLVGQEIQFIKNYIDLQLLKFESNEVKINIEVTGTFNQQLIEPGIFIPFLENAFKYGTEPEHEANIELRIDISESTEVSFFIRNYIYRTHTPYLSPGTGIKAAKLRLDLVYPNKYQLTIQEDLDYSVSLKIDTI